MSSENTPTNNYSKIYQKFESSAPISLETYKKLEGYEGQILINNHTEPRVNANFPPLRLASRLSQYLSDEGVIDLKDRQLFTESVGTGIGLFSTLKLVFRFSTYKYLAILLVTAIIGCFKGYFYTAVDEVDRKFTESLQNLLSSVTIEDLPSLQVDGLSSFLKMKLPPNLNRVNSQIGQILSLILPRSLYKNTGRISRFTFMADYCQHYCFFRAKLAVSSTVILVLYTYGVRAASKILWGRVAKYFLVKATKRSVQEASLEEGATTNQRIMHIAKEAYDIINDFYLDILGLFVTSLQSAYYLRRYLVNHPEIYTIVFNFLKSNVKVEWNFTAILGNIFNLIYMVRLWLIGSIIYYTFKWLVRNIYCDGLGPLEIKNQESKADSEQWALMSSIVQQNKLSKNYQLDPWYYYLFTRNNLAATIFQMRSNIRNIFRCTDMGKLFWDFAMLWGYLLDPSFRSVLDLSSLFSTSDLMAPIEFSRKITVAYGALVRLGVLGGTLWQLMTTYPEYIKYCIDCQLLAIKLESSLREKSVDCIPMTYRRDGKKKIVLDQTKLSWLPKPISLTLDLEKMPQWSYIIGPSGGGKTATTDLLLGIRDFSSGSATTHGKLKIHMITQYPGFVYGTLEENITFCSGRDVDEEALEKAFEWANISQLATRRKQLIIPSSLSYSGGQTQRINFARFFYRWLTLERFERPDILILDEAFSAIDIKNSRAIKSRLNRLDLKYLAVTHSYTDIQPEDRVIYLDSQNCIEDTFEEIKKNEHVVKTLFRS